MEAAIVNNPLGTLKMKTQILRVAKGDEQLLLAFSERFFCRFEPRVPFASLTAP